MCRRVSSTPRTTPPRHITNGYSTPHPPKSLRLYSAELTAARIRKGGVPFQLTKPSLAPPSSSAGHAFDAERLDVEAPPERRSAPTLTLLGFAGAAHTETPMTNPTPCAVLDTNVVLDWLVFRDVRCQPLVEAITSGSLKWIASDAMQAELLHVLARGAVDAWAPDHEALWAAWRQFSQPSTLSGRQLVEMPPRCTDPDDQKFIDYAMQHEAAWLLTRDRAVLRLAGRASKRGLRILTPERWGLLNPR